ncbi:hypothetical protein [Anaeroselena agilis]|uniref:N-acetyltransferase domain-containing protein n=1 Tax=Anaeroselena agilis TaxID=3063788 RepID=A0ABU3P3J7_9FIRM|nr:hypothetical protein [Selenomonadales bacterium 4137-cl]
MADGRFRLVPVGPDNVALVGEVFRAVYGEGYVDPVVYRPESLLKKIAQGQLAGLLALDPAGRPAGYVALGSTAPNHSLWEEKGLIVVPGYSKTDAGTALACHFGDRAVWPAGVDGVFASAVCHHYFSQVICAKAGWVVSAVQLDLFDAAILSDRPEDVDRISCSLFFSPMPPAAVPCYWPAAYFDVMAALAEERNDPPGAISAAQLPVTVTTDLEVIPLPTSDSMKVNVFRVGGDWAAAVERLVAEARRRRALSVQLFIDTACPSIGEAVRVLRARGFFFGGLAPRWFGSDGLLMQQVFANTRYDLIRLYPDTAAKLLAFIRADRLAVGQERG